jgi:hypothetical protein
MLTVINAGDEATGFGVAQVRIVHLGRLENAL